MSADEMVDVEEAEEDLDDFVSPFGDRYALIYAPHGNINTGSVHGDQHVRNAGAGSGHGARRVEAHEGPISALEILDAKAGFAEPEWFPSALAQLDTRILFLTGEPGTGRRTAALNLLYHHSGGSMDLRALDSDEDLASWRPIDTEARGYLVFGLLPQHPLGPAVIAKLRSLLNDADARMVIVLPHEPERVRSLARELHVSPVRCEPPPPRAVFVARLEAAVPDLVRRERLLAGLEPGRLDGLLTAELVPSQVAELVAEISTAGDDGPDVARLHERLSYLAEREVPELLKKLRDDPDGLAFLLATSVFEGLDHRTVRDEAERLLALADGRLDSVLPNGGDGDGQARPNPRFVFRRSLEDLLRTVRAECAPRELRSNGSYTYTVEPVRFTRHRQAEAVLRHVWRQYSELSGLMTEWMDSVPASATELAEPVGRLMGLAAGWGGGRSALGHIRKLARSDRPTSRTTAAFAMGIAAQDPVLAGEIKYRLNKWSRDGGWQLRSTVAHACGTDFGMARPVMALSLLGHAYRGTEGVESGVASAVVRALWTLFASGYQGPVLRRIAEWANQQGSKTALAFGLFPRLLDGDPFWFLDELETAGGHSETIVDLIRRTLDDDFLFDGTRSSLIGWCRLAARDERRRTAVEALFTGLAQEMSYGVMRLFVDLYGEEDPELPGRHIAHHTLEAWRRGEPQPFRAPHPSNGGPDDRRQ